MLFDLHCHTNRYSSCSILEPADAVKRAYRKGLQGLVITEHHRLWQDEELQQLKQDVEVDNTFVLLSGQEVGTDKGHVLVFGAPHSVTEKISVQELRTAFPDAALVLAHPYRKKHIVSTRLLLNPLFDAIEIFNTNHSIYANYTALCDWHTHRFTALAGSDAHAIETVATYPTLFDHPIRTVNELAGEIKNGRCRPFYKEIPKAGSNQVVTEITFGVKGIDEVRPRIIVKKIEKESGWQRQKYMYDVVQQFHDITLENDRYRVPRILEFRDESKLLIEEGQRGKSLHRLLQSVTTATGIHYFRLSAEWLATMHNKRICIEGKTDVLKREKHKFSSYEKLFKKTHNRYCNELQQVIAVIDDFETGLVNTAGDSFIQCHGDYHPKNIIIGQDRAHDINTLYISVIDFNNTVCFRPEYDVGYFLAQFFYQLAQNAELGAAYTRELFIETYSGKLDPGLECNNRYVDYFELRTLLSITAFLIRVGKGDHADMDLLFSRAHEIQHRPGR